MGYSATIERRTDFYIETCIECGVEFGVPAEFNRRRREDHKSFCCPSGHRQHYAGETEAEKLRRELARAKQREACYEDQLRDEREARETAKHRAAAYKGHTTRLKKRAAAGVCPCCSRHFTNLERHMKSQHPEFAASDDNVVEMKAG